MNLLEAYKNRINEAKISYEKNFNKEMPKDYALTLAAVLDNSNRFLTEAFNNSEGTQRADLKSFKKFSLNISNAVLPNLIANELVMVKPMTSWTGYISYMKYVAGSNKGQTQNGDLFSDPFRFGEKLYDHEFTGDRVTETADKAYTNNYSLAWTPVVKGAFKDNSGVAKDVKVIKSTGEVVFADIDSTGKVQTTLAKGDRVAYVYDNVVIPQNDLPTLRAEMAGITVTAKARRIAIYYSQIAAFQAKQDYGEDLHSNLAKQAVSKIQFDIDNEVVALLKDNAEENPELVFNKTVPVGVSKAQHYEGFTELVTKAGTALYTKTGKYFPNYLVVAPDLLEVLQFLKGFKSEAKKKVAGPFKAGTLDGVGGVFVSPMVAKGHFFFGLNDNDFVTSAAVLMPYMTVVPTQLLGTADGGMSQGWSTVYGLELLNKDLLVAGHVTEEPQPLPILSSKTNPIITKDHASA